MLTKIKNTARGLNRLFWVTVIIPTTLASLYFGLIASDVYISQSKFVIYNPQSPSPSSSGLSTLLAGAGFSTSTYGVYAAHDYILSRDALAQLQRTVDIERMYSGRGADWINRFGGLIYFRRTFENLYKYYGNMVGVDVDTTSNISTLTVDAYTPTDAQRINSHLLAQAQQLIDRLNAQADAQGVAFYAKEVKNDEAQVQAAAVALARYRNTNHVFAPVAQSTFQLQLISKLQDQLLQQQTVLAQSLVNTPRNPQIPLLKKSITALEHQIVSQQARVAGAPNSLASESVPYERLFLTQSFAEKKLSAAITALEEARIQAQKQQLFIETVVKPNLPDEALEPKRVRGVLATLIVGLLLWGVFSVVLAGVRDTMTVETNLNMWERAKLQGRVIWALTMREVITRFGREGLGAFWLMAEPAMFVIGVMVIFSHIESNSTFSVAEYLAVSYPTLLFWRNGTGRVTKAIEINRALLHHQPIRPIDIIYSRILLEFSGAASAFFVLYMIFIQIGICHWPADALTMAFGYILVIWFSFGFVMFMAALSDLSETIERISHVILYLMLPFSGVFIPLYAVPQQYRNALLYFPLVDAVEFFHHGYYGGRMPTYYHLGYTMFTLLALTVFAYALLNIAIRKVQLN